MRYYNLFLLSSLFAQPTHGHGVSELLVHSDWQLIGGSHDWVMVGYITFKNKLHTPQIISELILQWHGHPIAELTGSLFRKKHRLQFMAIEEFCLADSSWDSDRQQLKLKFCTPIKLSAEMTMYLTLLVPSMLEPLLKNGYFSIDPMSMPLAFKSLAQNPIARIYPGHK